MSNFVIALLFSLGSSVWVWNKFTRRTGGNAQKSIGGAAAVFVIAFIFMLAVLSAIKN